MPTTEKQALVAEIKERLSGSAGVILTDYRGLSVKEMQELRVKLRAAGGEMTIYKNSLAQIAVRELELPSMDEYLAGPTAFVFVSEDPVAPAKAVVDFAKEHKAFEVKGGLIESRIVAMAQIKAMAALPSREALIAQLMGTLQAPASAFARMLNAPVGAFARAVRAVADQKAAA